MKNLPRLFGKMLEEYVPRTGYSPPPSPRILDLGCADCPEAHVLTEYFRAASLTGIDIHGGLLKIPREAYLNEPEKYRFICGDARELGKLVEGEFDIIVARNPDVISIEGNWKKIFGKAYGAMKPGGLLIATALRNTKSDLGDYHDLRRLISRAGFKSIKSFENNYPFQVGYAILDNDIIFARKF